MTDQNELVLADTVASMVSRLRFLEKKSQQDDQTLALQRRQIEDLTEELATVEHNARFDLADLQKQRDDAMRRADETKVVIDRIANDAMAGLRAIRGNQTPAVMPQKVMNTSVADQDDRLPKIEAIRK